MQRDTDSIYKMLTSAGYDSNSIQYLSPDSDRPEVDQKVSAENVKKALESLAKQIECCDTLFIYVASHGSMTGDVIYQVRDSTGQVINIKNEDPRTAPSEMESKSQKYMGQQLADGTRTRLRSDGSSYLEKVPKNYQLMIRTKKGAKAEVVLGSELANLLKEIKSCKKLLLLDTSHSAAIFHFTAAVPGLFTIAASDVGVTAQQSWRGGDFTVPFVNAYTESTEEADSDGDGHVTPREAASFADSSIQGEAQLIIDSYRKKLEANGRTPEQIIEELRRWINPGFRWLRASRLWNQDPQFQTPKQLCICSAQLELRTRIPLATTAAAETVAPSPTATRQSSGTATPTATVTPTPEPQPAATLVPTPAVHGRQQLADGSERTRLRSDGSSYLEKVPKNYQLMIRTKKGAKAEVVLGSELANLLKEITKPAKSYCFWIQATARRSFTLQPLCLAFLQSQPPTSGRPGRVTAQQSWRSYSLVQTWCSPGPGAVGTAYRQSSATPGGGIFPLSMPTPSPLRRQIQMAMAT